MLSNWLFGEVTTESLFAEFVLAGVVVVLTGARFTRLADTLADRLNLTGGWIGLILLATVTSLPEVVAGGTATAIGNVDLAFAAVLGSCCFNVTLIFLLNAVLGGGSVLRGVRAMHTLTSSFGLLLIGIALLGVVLAGRFADRPAVGQMLELSWAGLIVVVYVGCMRLIYKHEHGLNAEDRRATAGAREDSRASGSRTSEGGGRRLYTALVLMAIILVAAAWWLARLGDTLSTHRIELIGRPLGATFVGACFLALATSLPEIATSIAAVRLGNLDLALGNIFGSNMFNIFVFPMLKVVSLARGDELLMAPERFHSTEALITGLLAILLTAIAVGGLAYQSRRRMLRRFGFDSILIAVTYLGGMCLLFMDGR